MKIKNHARWINNDDNYPLWHICSACGEEALDDDCYGEFLTKYCPNCGAKMDNAEYGKEKPNRKTGS